jgi:phage FluMu gp28-like protein
VLWGAFHGELTTIISIGELESSEVLDKAKRHAGVLAGLGSAMAAPVRQNAETLTFASGGRILALPSTGGRSFTGNVFLDEFAYQEHPKKVWDAAAAVTMLGGRLRVASTPNGIGNDFHSLWKRATDPALGWKQHEIALEHAIAEGYPVDLSKCWTLAKGDPRLFDQLFNCKFLDGSAQYIPTALIDAASVTDLYTYEGEYFAGLDIGRTADRTVLVVLRKRPDEQRFLAWVASCKRTDSDALEALVEWCFQVFKPRRLCVDSTGLGAFPAERMQKKHGRQRVEPIVFSQPVKEDLATTMYSAFAEDTLKIAKTTDAIRLPRETPRSLLRDIEPRAAERLREDVCAIRREVTSAGNVRYDAPHTDEGHADSAWALALALHACGKGPSKKHEIAPQSANRSGVTILT